jgi:hypothetical protein
LIDARAAYAAEAAVPQMTRDELLAQLKKLLSSQFEEVLFCAQVPQEHLSASSAPQVTRAVEVIRYLEDQKRLPELACVIAQVIAGRRRDGGRSRRTARSRRTILLAIAIAAAAGIVALGLVMIMRSQRFDVTVFLHGPTGHQAMSVRNRGRVSLDLGGDKRIEAVGDKGEVRFTGIPGDLRDREVALGLDDDLYELVDPRLTIRLNEEAVYAAIQPRQLRLAGYVSDEQGRPLQQARAVIAGAAATTDQDGRFEVKLPADLPEGERSITIIATGYAPWRGQAVPGGDPLRAQLSWSDGN